MKQIKQFLLLSVLVGFTSCTVTKSAQEYNKDVVYQEILTMFNSYHNDVKEQGLLAQLNYLDASEDFYWLPVGYKTPQNYTSLKTIIIESAKNLKSIELEWVQLQITPVTGQFATYSGVVKVAMKDIQDRLSAAYVIETGTLIKRVNEWKLLSGQSQLSKPSYK